MGYLSYLVILSLLGVSFAQSTNTKTPEAKGDFGGSLDWVQPSSFGYGYNYPGLIHGLSGIGQGYFPSSQQSWFGGNYYGGGYGLGLGYGYGNPNPYYGRDQGRYWRQRRYHDDDSNDFDSCEEGSPGCSLSQRLKGRRIATTFKLDVPVRIKSSILPLGVFAKETKLRFRDCPSDASSGYCEGDSSESYDDSYDNSYDRSYGDYSY